MGKHWGMPALPVSARIGARTIAAALGLTTVPAYICAMAKLDKSNITNAALPLSDARALEARAGEVADILALMANPYRLRILCRLAEGEASVGMLVEEVGLSQSALSQHLARLRAGGLVTTRRAAQTIHYSLAGAETQAIMTALYEVFCGPKRAAASLDRTEQASE